MKHFTLTDIESMEQRYRAAFINSLGGFKSVILIGTQDHAGKTNLAVFNSLFHIGSHPALCGLIFRPDTVFRHTLENIMHTGHYTVNHIHEGIYRQAHQTAARYDRGLSEFDAAGLATEYHPALNAPYVRESHLKFGMVMQERHELVINGTILLIGSIVETFVPEDLIMPDGYVDIEKAGTLAGSGLDSYHSTKRLARLSYPKTDSLPQMI